MDLDSLLDLANVSQVEIDGAAGDGINSDYKETAGEAVCSDFIKELSYEYQTGWQDAKLAVTLQLSLGIRRAYDSRGGERVPAQYYQKGEIDIAPKIPKKEGFDFKGWYSDEKCEGQAWIFGKAVTAPSILYAKWEKSVVVPEKEPEPEKTGYQIYLDSGDEIVKSEETFSWNEKELPIYDEPTKTGYRFDGWFTAKVGRGNEAETKREADFGLADPVDDSDNCNRDLRALYVAEGVLNGEGAGMNVSEEVLQNTGGLPATRGLLRSGLH